MWGDEVSVVGGSQEPSSEMHQCEVEAGVVASGTLEEHQGVSVGRETWACAVVEQLLELVFLQFGIPHEQTATVVVKEQAAIWRKEWIDACFLDQGALFGEGVEEVETTISICVTSAHAATLAHHDCDVARVWMPSITCSLPAEHTGRHLFQSLCWIHLFAVTPGIFRE